MASYAPIAPDLVPARMVNEFAYCPRLSYMEWVQGEFADSADTVEGRFRHRRVDRESGNLELMDDGDVAEPIHARSVMLSNEAVGAIARIDLVELEGRLATPVDYKRGKVPNIAGGVYEPERVQLCVQGLLLRANGFESNNGVIYYVGSKQRVSVPFDDDLIARTRELVSATREMAIIGEMPPPLVDSPKCPRCSLVGICLPDEVAYLNGSDRIVRPDDVRRMAPARDDALPMYLITQGAVLGKYGDNLTVRIKGEVVSRHRLIDVSSVSIFGNAQITAQAAREILARNIPVYHFSYGGWLNGITWGMAHKNVELRVAQFRGAADGETALNIVRDIVSVKLRNSRVMLRRNHTNAPQAALAELSRLAKSVGGADSLQTLLGIEDAAARVYFSHFAGMLKTDAALDFRGRNRRPPTDPVNAVLSFLYSMLMRQCFVAALTVGFDPYMGFYHQPKYGRPALALDIAEEFRSVISDSAALTLFNNGELRETDFVKRSGAVALTDGRRKATIWAFERRMDTLATHPLFGYSISYHRILEAQARLLGRHLLGELKKYPAFATR